MMNYTPLNVLPADIQQDWMATLQKATATAEGVFQLVNIRRTRPKSFEEQRVIVLVVDENGFPIPNIRVAFSYSTADQYVLTPDFLWSPPPPSRAFIVPTAGSGQIDQIQGSGVKQGEPGGITVYIFEPEYSSDVVTGAGMLADHTGLHLTYQLRRTGVTPLMDRIASLEARVAALEAR
ncbi:MAG: hypothetical protein HYR94_03310 [Chloroflexi bacterium]|nr:hypothetical protein [Chloroflexota bacterium]